MASNDHIHRVHLLTAEIVAQNAVIREVIAQATEILKTPVPDTFLGRKTYEPYPIEPHPAGQERNQKI